MNKWLKISVAGIGLIGAGVALAYRSGESCWNAETARIAEQLQQSALPGETETFSFKNLAALPAPVARYFRFALKEGQPLIRTARIRHAGEFNLNGKWIRFESVQYMSSAPPAFVWDANMKINSLMNIRVRDGFRNGQGSMRAKILSLFTVMNAGGADEKLAAGALQRYLAESVWLPTALLPRENLQWSAIDETHAKATLTDAGVTVSLEFEFGETGEIVGVFAPARFKESGGEYKPFPWAGRFRNYREQDDMMIPTEGEVEWRMPEGGEPYWRGKIVDVEYGFDD